MITSNTVSKESHSNFYNLKNQPLNNAIVLFFLSPILGVIQAFKHYKEVWAKNSVWFFVVFYGFTMYRPEAMDSNRYVERLKFLYNAPVNWDSFASSFYSDEGTTLDIYQPLVTYVMSLFTNSGNLLFAVFGIVFGYFFSRNIWLLLDYTKGKKMNAALWILLASFACVIGFWELNGVRMWTAAHIFFYGAFQFLVNRKKNGLLIACSCVLVHFSFVLPIAILVFYNFVKLPWKLLYFAFIASFFVSELNIHFIGDLLGNYAPEFLLPKVKTYTSDEYVDTLAEAPLVNWYVVYYLKCVGWAIFVMISSIYFSSIASIKSDKSFSNLFGFTLLFLTIGNFMSLLPSGTRYLTIARLFAMALLFLYYLWYESKLYRKHLLFVTPFLVFFLIISIRVACETTTFATVLTNPIIALFIDAPVPLINLLK